MSERAKYKSKGTGDVTWTLPGDQAGMKFRLIEAREKKRMTVAEVLWPALWRAGVLLALGAILAAGFFWRVPG